MYTGHYTAAFTTLFFNIKTAYQEEYKICNWELHSDNKAKEITMKESNKTCYYLELELSGAVGFLPGIVTSTSDLANTTTFLLGLVFYPFSKFQP